MYIFVLRVLTFQTTIQRSEKEFSNWKLDFAIEMVSFKLEKIEKT